MKAFVIVSILSCWSCAGLVAQFDGDKARGANRSREAACSLLPPQESRTVTLDDAALLNAYNAQVHLIRGLYATAMVSGEAGKDREAGKLSRELPGIIYILKPNLVRISGVLRLDSSRGFEMTSDGREFSLLVPEDGKKIFVVGPADAPARSKIPRENLRPQPFLDALRWQEGKLLVASSLPRVPVATHVLDIELPPSRNGVRTARVEFDLRDGVVKMLTAYGGSGQIIYEARYSDWREAKTMSEKGPAGCFPRRVHLSRPEDDYELNLRILQVNLNPEIPLSTFLPHPPHGIPIVRLDSSGNPIHP